MRNDDFQEGLRSAKSITDGIEKGYRILKNLFQKLNRTRKRILDKLEKIAQERPDYLASEIESTCKENMKGLQKALDQIEDGPERDAIKAALEKYAVDINDDVQDRANLIDARMAWKMDYRPQLNDVSLDLAVLENMKEMIEDDIASGDLSKTADKISELSKQRDPLDVAKESKNFEFEKRMKKAQKDFKKSMARHDFVPEKENQLRQNQSFTQERSRFE